LEKKEKAKEVSPKAAPTPKAKKEKVVVEAVSVSAAAEEAAPSSSFTTSFSSEAALIVSAIKRLDARYRAEKKQDQKDLKAAQKESSKGKRRVRVGGAPRTPSGFQSPTRISNELADFLSLPHGTEIARTEVTKALSRYINEKGLKSPENGQNINPDASLTKLLNLTSEDKLTYFKLQKFMKHHFHKKSSSVAAAAALV
jgi:upstream activation factor subunit UAF30